MRILFATEYYPPFAPGGAEWTTAAWAAALAKRGHEVTVVTPNYGALPRESAAGVTVIRVPFPVRLIPGQEAPWLLHRNPFFYAYFATWVAYVARRGRADVIHAQSKGALVPSWLAARALRRPVLFTVRDVGLICPLASCTFFENWETFDCSSVQYVRKCVPFFLRNYGAPSGALQRVRVWTSLLFAWADHRLRQTALGRVDGVLGVSAGILALHPPRLVGNGRASVVYSPPPPVADAVTAPDGSAARKEVGIGDGPLVLYAGKLSLGKGTPVLMEALPEIRRAVPGVCFVFAGKGDFALPPGDDVRALGAVPQPTLFGLYRAADVVVIPSIWPEPLSRVLLEAMRFGRPVVATAVGGTPEIVEDGVTGLLVPKRDPAALAAAVTTLLRDPERRARMGAAAAARSAARILDEDHLVLQLLGAYEAAAKRATV